MVFIACIALGVMAIAGVGSVAASLGEGLTREGRTLLGGDVAFSLIQREAKPEEVAFLREDPRLSASGLTVTCREGMIEEVRLCLTRDLDPRPCGPDARTDCRLEDALMAPAD